MEASNFFSIVLLQIMTFVVYALVGVYAVKKNIIAKDGLGVLSAFIIKIALPTMIFIYTLNGATKEQFIQSLSVLGAGALMFGCLLAIGVAASTLFKLNYNEKQVYRACTMFGNVGFMGIPILLAVLPERGMLYMSLFTIVDQLSLWTIGLTLCTPEKASNSMSLQQKLLKMINPATIAIISATILIFAGVKLPLFLNTALMKIGNSATPLALAYLGGMFALMDISAYVKRAEIYLAVVLKMVLFPIVFCHILKLTGINSEIVLTVSILSAMPSMSSIPMIAQSQGSAGEYAAGMVFITTVCFIFTLPLVSLFIG